MYVVALPEGPGKYFSSSEVVPLKVSTSWFEKLKLALGALFRKSGVNVIRTKPEIYSESLFLKGVGSIT